MTSRKQGRGNRLGRYTAGGRLGAIIFLALAVKVVLLFWLLPHLQAASPQDYAAERFPDGYDLIAWNLLQGNGYRLSPDTSLTMLRTPGCVLLLAAIFAVFGGALLAVQVVNVAFSATTAVLTHILARKVGLSKPTATIAALVFLFHPGVVIAESRGGLESVLTFCLVASVLLAVVAMERQQWPNFAMVGVVNGLAMLIKSTVAPVLPVLFLYGVWKTRDALVRRRLLSGMAICGLATVLVMTPWVARNYRISGEFIPTMTLTGLALFQNVYVIKHLGSNLQLVEILQHAADEQVAIANAMGLKMKGSFFPQFFTVNDEVSFYRELGRRAVDDYKREPQLILRGIVHNGWAFWVEGRTYRATMFNAILTIPLLVLSGLGLRLGMKRRWRVFQLFLITAAFMIPHLAIFAVARYSIPLIPFLAILAAIPLADWFERLA